MRSPLVFYPPTGGMTGYGYARLQKSASSVYNEPLMQRVDPHAYSDRREIPKYRVSDVALYLGIKERTLHNWFFGSSRTIGGEKRDYERLIEPALHNPQGPSLSFFNLAEALGHALFINVSKGGQLGFASILDLYLQRIECDKSGFPIKVYPLRDVNDPDKTIVIISNVASGRPTVSGTGIRVETIWNRSQGGETTDALAEDYGIEPRVIEKAISYFTHVRAA